MSGCAGGNTAAMTTDTPPMDPNTDEASKSQLELARKQGDAYGEALKLMTTKVADGGATKRAGDYVVGYAIEKAEGMYFPSDGSFEWREPAQGENLHLEVVVCDAADGRFVPCVTVEATLVDGDGNDVGTHEQPLIWHPMLYHYGRNWQVPGDGQYTLRVHVEPPRFMRHDKTNGKRFMEPVDVEFAGVQVKTGRK